MLPFCQILHQPWFVGVFASPSLDLPVWSILLFNFWPNVPSSLHIDSQDFCWRGARIHSAECLERLSRALPKATMVFKMEVCGVFAGRISTERGGEGRQNRTPRSRASWGRALFKARVFSLKFQILGYRLMFKTKSNTVFQQLETICHLDTPDIWFLGFWKLN